MGSKLAREARVCHEKCAIPAFTALFAGRNQPPEATPPPRSNSEPLGTPALPVNHLSRFCAQSHFGSAYLMSRPSRKPFPVQPVMTDDGTHQRTIDEALLDNVYRQPRGDRDGHFSKRERMSRIAAAAHSILSLANGQQFRTRIYAARQDPLRTGASSGNLP
jgi:hypothetical protein